MSSEDIRTLRSRAASGWLIDLSARFPSVVGLKNTESALAGEGDLDLSAAASEWDAAVAAGTEVVRNLVPSDSIVGIECRHVPSVRICLWHPGAGLDLLQLDLSDALVTRGFAWARPERLVEVSETDSRGFRLAPPTVQAFVGLITRASSSDNVAASSYADVLQSELEARDGGDVIQQIVSLFDTGLMRRGARGVLEAVEEGSPWGPSFRRFAAFARISALGSPSYALQRWRFKRRGPCSAAQLVITDRRRCTADQLRALGGQPEHRLLTS